MYIDADIFVLFTWLLILVFISFLMDILSLSVFLSFIIFILNWCGAVEAALAFFWLKSIKGFTWTPSLLLLLFGFFFESAFKIFSICTGFASPEFNFFKSLLNVLFIELIDLLFALKLFVLKLKLLKEFFLEIFDVANIILLLPILEFIEFY